ncbi:MAG: DUF2892 domain-containing protein [Flavobacteriales bacterium]|nr:DUF2892 domain-containing protein [Flavobacteriales bacterium]
MKKNIGAPDKTTRVLLAVLFVYLYASQFVTGTVGVLLLAVGVVFMLTTALSYCPLYSIFGITSFHKK